ncbi:phage head-tail joining protein [Ketogulonicigenium vulgare]|uniref:phage head-tail joining protein n=1 Tax=Ketogulonicigenium vulgare TaxID=92945 RepID=UPI0023592F30|nr:hypothetical protein [Ketogulonicigenium vulgare]
MTDKLRKQIEQIDDMMAKGALSLEQNGEKVTFRSLDEMQRTRSMLVRRLDGAPRKVLHTPKFRRG